MSHFWSQTECQEWNLPLCSFLERNECAGISDDTKWNCRIWHHPRDLHLFLHDCFCDLFLLLQCYKLFLRRVKCDNLITLFFCVFSCCRALSEFKFQIFQIIWISWHIHWRLIFPSCKKRHIIVNFASQQRLSHVNNYLHFFQLSLDWNVSSAFGCVSDDNRGIAQLMQSSIV